MRVRVGRGVGGRGQRNVLGVPSTLDISRALPAHGMVRRVVPAAAHRSPLGAGPVAARGRRRVLYDRLHLLRAEEDSLYAFHLPSVGAGRNGLPVLGHRLLYYVSGACTSARA